MRLLTYDALGARVYQRPQLRLYGAHTTPFGRGVRRFYMSTTALKSSPSVRIADHSARQPHARYHSKAWHRVRQWSALSAPWKTYSRPQDLFRFKLAKTARICAAANLLNSLFTPIRRGGAGRPESLIADSEGERVRLADSARVSARSSVRYFPIMFDSSGSRERIEGRIAGADRGDDQAVLPSSRRRPNWVKLIRTSRMAQHASSGSRIRRSECRPVVAPSVLERESSRLNHYFSRGTHESRPQVLDETRIEKVGPFGSARRVLRSLTCHRSSTAARMTLRIR